MTYLFHSLYIIVFNILTEHHVVLTKQLIFLLAGVPSTTRILVIAPPWAKMTGAEMGQRWWRIALSHPTTVGLFQTIKLSQNK